MPFFLVIKEQYRGVDVLKARAQTQGHRLGSGKTSSIFRDGISWSPRSSGNYEVGLNTILYFHIFESLGLLDHDGLEVFFRPWPDKTTELN